MITINLRPGQKRRRAGNPLQGVVEQLRGMGAKVKDPMLLAAAASWVVVVGGLGFIYVSSATQLSALEPRLEQVRAEHKRFKTFLREKHRQEVIRDSLLRQITVIRDVDGDRYVWPHVLDELSRALPAYTWLVDVGVVGSTPAPVASGSKAKPDSADTAAAPVRPPMQFQINGRTVDIQAYTRFLRQLEASPWIADVTPVSAQTVVEQERPVTAFTIKATYRKADSAYIRTVPLSQSVR